MNSHLETRKKINKGANKSIYEKKLTCRNCYRNCQMTLLMEDCSILCVEGDSCRKGQIFAYKEVRKNKAC
ncbi:MAG: hypothetical protein PWP16_45 [Eubacteriaceae bacterium]|jgi:CxxC motif-containing protein|nr:hypothetical protein [Eubacteriaceae bacterium]MDK2904288.1 hypothetical protein [Eubacteriaceae bacterium]MDK2937679.1 hypothetical protein [Eubacteriaceae bacterium]MDK2960955.1 hypothetical protein [Eubacteriaceae bacterium]MDN5306682.1 hypothetical protein [Eubacteriaceae bacterium]